MVLVDLRSNVTVTMEASDGKLDKDSAEINALREVLLQCIHPEPSITDVHLNAVERDFVVDSTKTLVYCYAPTLDGNGRLRIEALAEFMRDRVFRFVIPRKDVEAAEAAKDESGDMSRYIRLHERAKRTFTAIKNTGEGGEFLLFALAEKEFSPSTDLVENVPENIDGDALSWCGWHLRISG